MPRAFIYARYSTDLQNERSIDDQLVLDRAYCARRGFTVTGTFADRAISGASAINRPDYLRMVDAALAGGCDVIVAEDLDRLSRNQTDIAWLFERLNFAGVAIETAVDGVINEMHVGLKGTMNALALKNLAFKVHRGMAGAVRRGHHPGGRAYGYRPVKGEFGQLAIIVEEAEIVRRIFRDYVAGKSPRAISGELNAENIAPPRKGYWRASTINGHKGRSTGILQNELYCGRLVWNRVRMVKNPATGKRLSRIRPQEEWQRADVPHLRIIADDIFDEAQKVRSRLALPGGMRTRPKRIFSGLLRCGACGSGMSKKDSAAARPRVHCTRMHESGSCSNRRSYYLDDIEQRVIGCLRDELGTEQAIAYFVECYNAERRRQATSQSPDQRSRLAAELTDVERRLERAVGAVISGQITQQEADAHLPALRARRDALEREIAAHTTPVVTLRPDARTLYGAHLDRLGTVDNGGAETIRTIRSMIETLTIMPAPTSEAPRIVLAGDLGPILDLDRKVSRGVLGGSGGEIWSRTPPRLRVPVTLILEPRKAA